METIFERVGALDVHKAQVTACVRVPDDAGRRASHVAEFVTTVQGLMALHRLARRRLTPSSGSGAISVSSSESSAATIRARAALASSRSRTSRSSSSFAAMEKA